MGELFKYIAGAILVLVFMVACSSVGRISTGETGVRTAFNGTVFTEEVRQGWYIAIFDKVRSYNTKEVEVPLNDLQPKAKDNLTLEDLDISIFYTINENQVAEQIIKYANMTVSDDGVVYPSYLLVHRVSRGAVYDAISKFESLTLHTNRSEIENMVFNSVQTELNKTDPNVFTITKVIVRNVKTDPALETSIQQAVDMQKQVEKKQHELALAKAEAERKVAEAQGIAQSNKIISDSLTDKYLQYRALEAQEKFAGEGTHTVLLPTNVTPLINVK